MSRMPLHSLTATILCLSAVCITYGAITQTDDVQPSYPGEDPWTINQDLIVGDQAAGSMSIDGGSDVIVSSGYNALVGNHGLGSVEVKDPGSTLGVLGYLYIGIWAQGDLSITGGGQVTSVNAGIGVMSGSEGVVRVRGSGSRWDNGGSVFVGGYGDGDLVVDGGGRVDIGGILYIGGFDAEEFGIDVEGIGYDSNRGVVSVDGSGSYLEAVGIGVGISGDGRLEVKGGGDVNGVAVVVGIEEGSRGVVVVDGEGSELRLSSDTVVFDELPQMEGDGRMFISNGGRVVVDGVGGFLGVSEQLAVGSEGSGVMEIANGGRVSADEVYIGGVSFDLLDEGYDPDHVPAGSGEVNVTGAGSVLDVRGPATLYVGYFGQGVLDIADGGEVSSDTVVVGAGPEAIGIINVSGVSQAGGDEGEGGVIPVGNDDGGVSGASLLDVEEMLLVGAWGDGQVEITDGGHVRASEVYIGGFDASDSEYYELFGPAEGSGVVNVTGAGSVLEVTGFDSLVVGSGGTGVLRVEEGGRVESLLGFVGGYFDEYDDVDDVELVRWMGGDGQVVVDGSGSSWSSLGIVVGVGGEGSLEVSGGGRVDSALGVVGFGPDSEGRVVVSGQDSVWANEAVIGVQDNDDQDGPPLTGLMIVGGWGQGYLDINGGGRVESGSMYIGGFDMVELGVEGWGAGPAAGSGEVNVTGAGSVLDVRGPATLYVGYFGQGVLDIADGGEVSSHTSYVGVLPDSRGSVTIGSGGTWINSGSLNVGYGGYGQITVEDGGRLENAGNTIYIGYGEGSNGTLTVRGSDSEVHDSGPTYVGYYGSGYLNISEGGKAYSHEGNVAWRQASTGEVLVTGAGSLWDITQDLYIGGGPSGPGGNGLVTVSDGGQIHVGGRLVMWPNGRLAGEGTVQTDTLVAKGTIAPGGSIGTMYVAGNLVFDVDSIYEVEISNNDSSDKIVVVGDVNIVGGTVKAIATETIVGSHEYKIVEASSVTGRFSVLDTALVHNVSSSGLEYDPNAVWLLITATAFNDPNFWNTFNQQQLGDALQLIAEQGGNDITDLLQQLDDPNAIPGAYDQLSGQTRPTLLPVVSGTSHMIFGTISDRFEGIGSGLLMRGGKGMDVTGPVAWAGQRSVYRYNPYSRVFAAGNGTAVLGDQPWGIWARGYGMFGDRAHESGVPGYEYNTYGVTLGADYRFRPDLTGGLAVGFSQTDVDYYRVKDESEIDALHIALYARYNPGTWYLTGIVGFGDLGFNTDRYVDLTDEHLTADFSGNTFSTYIEAGAKWRRIDHWQINPLASIQLSRVSIDAYKETGGSAALAFGSQDYDSIKGSLGARITTDVADWLGGSGLFELRGRWVHEFADIQSSVDAAFATNPDVVFQVRDAKLPRDSAVLGAGLDLELNKQTRFVLDYDVRLNPDETTHIVTLLGQYRW